jgi:hypothetical protein
MKFEKRFRFTKAKHGNIVGKKMCGKCSIWDGTPRWRNGILESSIQFLICRGYHCFDERREMMKSLSFPRGANWCDVGTLSTKNKRNSLRTTSCSLGRGNYGGWLWNWQ